MLSPCLAPSWVEHALVLGRLRRLERLALAVEKRRGVAHRRIEPQAVEAVAEVVVGVDVALAIRRACSAGSGAAASEPGCAPCCCVAIVPRRLLVLGEQRDQPRQVGRIAVAFHVGFGEADVAVEQHAPEEAPVPDLEHRLAGVGRLPKRRIVPSGRCTVRRPIVERSSAFRTKWVESVKRISAAHQLRRRRRLMVKFRSLAPELQGLPVDSGDDGKGHGRIGHQRRSTVRSVSGLRWPPTEVVSIRPWAS